MRIIFGVFCLVVGGFVVIFIILNDILMMAATLSIALGLLSAFLTYDAKVEKEKILQEEIRRKLTMIKEENESNLDLIKRLIERREKLYPPDLLAKKLKQKPKLKYSLLPEERKQIEKGGMWIQKENCSYYYALQVVELSHYFDDNFIETIKNYIDELRKLNSQKEFMQFWMVSRGNLNPDEVKDLYTAIDKAFEITKKMKKIIVTEIENRV